MTGDLRTAMEMLSTGEASPVAWPVLQLRADVFLAIGDAAAIDAAREVRSASHGTELDVGISGIAGLAGLIELRKHTEAARLLDWA